MFHANGSQKKAGVVIFVSEKLNIKKLSFKCKRQRRTLHSEQGIDPKIKHSEKNRN